MAGKSTRKNTPALEWFAAGLGALVALAMLAIIGREAVSGAEERPPEILVEATGVSEFRGGWTVEIVARNRASRTAAAVQISGTLREGGDTVETSSATISYVPGGSERRAGLFFTRDPRAHRLEVRATGYEAP